MSLTPTDPSTASCLAHSTTALAASAATLDGRGDVSAEIVEQARRAGLPTRTGVAA